MKTIVFVMILAFPGGSMPPYEEPMPDLATCLKKVETSVKDFEQADETFRYVAGCRLESKKSDPA